MTNIYSSHLVRVDAHPAEVEGDVGGDRVRLPRPRMRPGPLAPGAKATTDLAAAGVLGERFNRYNLAWVLKKGSRFSMKFQKSELFSVWIEL